MDACDGAKDAVCLYRAKVLKLSPADAVTGDTVPNAIAWNVVLDILLSEGHLETDRCDAHPAGAQLPHLRHLAHSSLQGGELRNGAAGISTKLCFSHGCFCLLQ